MAAGALGTHSGLATTPSPSEDRSRPSSPPIPPPARSPALPRPRALTQVDEAHDHVGLGEEVAVLQAGQRRPLGAEDGLVRVGEALALLGRRPRRPLLHGHGIVEVQHEHGGRVVLAVEVRPRAVRQAEDGEDLPLHLAALGAAQPPVDEAGVHLVVQREVGEDAAQPEGGGGGAQHQQPGGGLPAPRRHRGEAAAAAAAGGRRGGRGAAPPGDAPLRHARPRAHGAGRRPPRRSRGPLMARRGLRGGPGPWDAERGGGSGAERERCVRERSPSAAADPARRGGAVCAACSAERQREGGSGGRSRSGTQRAPLSPARCKPLGRAKPRCRREGERLTIRLLGRTCAAGSGRGRPVPAVALTWT